MVLDLTLKCLLMELSIILFSIIINFVLLGKLVLKYLAVTYENKYKMFNNKYISASLKF